MSCAKPAPLLLLMAFASIATNASGAEAELATTLEDVTVTATRVNKSAEKIPASVGSVDEEDIQFATQQIGLDESLIKMPGVFMQNRYNFAQDLRVSIRGFGARASFGIRGIKILVDGIPESLPDGQGSIDTIDLGSTESIEVIRGPVSSLYGNASGGAILLTSEEPPEEPFVALRPMFGSDGFEKHQLKFGGKADKLGYLLNISDLNYDGYRDNSRTESTQLNSKFNYVMGNDAKLTTVFNHTDSPIADDPGGLTAEQIKENPSQARGRNVEFDSGESVEQTKLGFVYEKDIGTFGNLMLRNYYVWRDFANKLPFVGGGSVDLERFFYGGGVQYTHASLVAGHSNRVSVGIDLDLQDDDRRRFDNNQGTLGNLTFDQNEEVSSMGLFVQDELSLSDKVELTLGARYDRVSFDVTDRFFDDGDDSGKRTLDKLSPSLGLRYSPTEKLNYYTNLSTSFETPTTTEFANPAGGGFNTSLEPQTATNYEVGVKGSFGKRNRYELALFRIDVKDELIPFELEDQPDREFFENAGESKRQGIEVLLAFEPLERMHASLAYTFSDFVFEQFSDGEGNNFAGKAIPGVPEQLIHADLSYTHNSGMYAYWDVLYADEVFANNNNSATSDAYTVSNLRLGYTRYSGKWEFSPFLGVNNLFDEHYNSNVRINAFGNRYFEPAPERNLYGGFTLRYEFGL